MTRVGCPFKVAALLVVQFKFPSHMYGALPVFTLFSTWWLKGEPGRSGVHGGAPRTGRQDASDDHLRRERNGPGTVTACPGVS